MVSRQAGHVSACVTHSGNCSRQRSRLLLADTVLHSLLRLCTLPPACALKPKEPLPCFATQLTVSLPSSLDSCLACLQSSVYHDGVGGVLYTWGGVNESVAFGASEKRDSNKGCLGHGEADLYRGQLLPVRVAGALEGKQGAVRCEALPGAVRGWEQGWGALLLWEAELSRM